MGTSFFPSKIIKWVTWEDYSHVALMFPEETGIVWEAWDKEGIRATKSLSDKHSAGTKVIVKVLRVTPDDYKLILAAAISQKGKPYDWKGCFRFSPMARLFMTSKPDYSEQKQWFCSCYLEWCLLQGNTPLADEAPNKMSPGDVMNSIRPQFVDTFICGTSSYKGLLNKIMEE